MVNRFICIIQDKRILFHVNDRIVRETPKDGLFSVTSLFIKLEGGHAPLFLRKITCYFSFPKRWIFMLGKFDGRIMILDQLKRRGRALAKRCFLSCEDEDHRAYYNPRLYG